MGISGGIAAYKSAELVRLLRKQNVEVRVVMTEAARQFVTPLTFQALSGNPVHTELLNSDEENAMGHINLARWANIFVVAPATANIIAKFSHGLADDLLSTLFLAATCRVCVAPAMNQAMWLNPVVQKNIKLLQEQGVQVLGPDQGAQACGETGPGRMLEPIAITDYIVSGAQGILQDKTVLISAGPTREPLDPVRYISNQSSGKMGYALAEAALRMGANVTLVSGPVNLFEPLNVEMIKVVTAEQMHHKIIELAPHHDIYIGAAAVADYRPVEIKQEKIKKQAGETRLILQKTKDILADVAELQSRPFTVGFAAETEKLEQYALEKLQTKKLDMIAANWVGRDQGGFDHDQNALQVYWRTGRKEIPMASKSVVAEQLIELIAERLDEKRTT